MNLSQVQRDARAGLGFVVLKTIIAVDEQGNQSMADWAIPETRMQVERIAGRRADAEGREGWTVTWKGRGWYDTLEAYLELYADSLDAARGHAMVVAPSCKYHLPGPDENEWRLSEYAHTTGALLDVWGRHGSAFPMPLEKDFSPTLAGSELASQGPNIARWLKAVSGLIRKAAGPRRISIGIKMLNAVAEDSFQVEMLRVLNESVDERPDFVAYANRLFDPDREFQGTRGVAYGGPDLSARNLHCLALLRAFEQRGQTPPFRYPLSATGDIDSGRTAARYLLRGASSFQMHTRFQLNDSEYKMKRRNKSECVLHEFFLHPETGLIAALLRLRRHFRWPEDWNVARMAAFCADPRNRLWADYTAMRNAANGD